jgi:hypothetical protein
MLLCQLHIGNLKTFCRRAPVFIACSLCCPNRVILQARYKHRLETICFEPSLFKMLAQVLHPQLTELFATQHPTVAALGAQIQYKTLSGRSRNEYYSFAR